MSSSAFVSANFTDANKLTASKFHAHIYDKANECVSLEDCQVWSECVTNFFTMAQALEDTHPRKNMQPARQLRKPEDIQKAWKTIMRKRRRVEPADRKAICDPNVIADMHCKLRTDWCKTEVTWEQMNYTFSQMSSIFNAYLFREFGGNNFVLAVWQSGIAWAPPKDMLTRGAVEHIATNFARRAQQVARAFTDHRNNEKTKEARTRSNKGLTAEQEQLRHNRQRAGETLRWTLHLEQLNAYKGKGKGNKAGFNIRWPCLGRLCL